MQQHHTWAVAELAIADGGAVFRGYRAGCIVLPRGCGRWIVDTGFRFHVLVSFLAQFIQTKKWTQFQGNHQKCKRSWSAAQEVKVHPFVVIEQRPHSRLRIRSDEDSATSCPASSARMVKANGSRLRWDLFIFLSSCGSSRNPVASFLCSVFHATGSSQLTL